MLGPSGASRTLPIPKRRPTSLLVAWFLIPISFPSPSSHHFCLLGITTGSVGTSENQFVPSVFCPHQMRPVGFFWGSTLGFTSVAALAPQVSSDWYFSGASRLWLSVIEVIFECLIGIVIFIGRWLWDRWEADRHQLGILIHQNGGHTWHRKDATWDRWEPVREIFFFHLLGQVC